MDVVTARVVITPTLRDDSEWITTETDDGTGAGTPSLPEALGLLEFAKATLLDVTTHADDDPTA